MTILGRFTQQPDEVLDYEIDFTAWLDDRADTITSYTLSAAPMGDGTGTLTISDDSRNVGVIRFFLSGGTSGEKYLVECTIFTTGGRTKQAEVQLAVKEV